MWAEEAGNRADFPQSKSGGVDIAAALSAIAVKRLGVFPALSGMEVATIERQAALSGLVIGITEKAGALSAIEVREGFGFTLGIDIIDAIVNAGRGDAGC
jgi:hypothetical protein